ncbi:MAG: hypothetical protein ACETWM_02140 [Candidatus Lokiarchaeia archaeon]
MKNNKKKIVATATIAILLALLAIPVLITSTNSTATATIVPLTSNLQSKEIPDLPGFDWNATSWILSSGIIELDLDLDEEYLEDGLVCVFAPINNSEYGAIAFELTINDILEFNDTNDNGVYDDDDELNQKIELDDLDWQLVEFTVDPGQELRVALSGTSESYGNLNITITFHIYVHSEVVTLPSSNVDTTVPGKSAVKIDIQIAHFPWDTPGDSLALLVELDDDDDLLDEHEFQIGDDTFDDDDDIYEDLVPQFNADESEIYFVTEQGIIEAIFNWFNYAINGSGLADVTASYNISGDDDGLELYLCVDYFGDQTLIFDPYIGLAQEQVSLLQLFVISYFASSQSAQLLIYGLIGAVAVIGIIAATIYIRRK